MLWMLSPFLTTFQILVFLGLVTFVQWKKHKWVLFCFPLPCVPRGNSGCSPIPEVGLIIWSKAPHFTQQPPVGPVNNNWEGDMIRKATSCFSKWEQWHWELWMKCVCTVFNIFSGSTSNEMQHDQLSSNHSSITNYQSSTPFCLAMLSPPRNIEPFPFA